MTETGAPPRVLIVAAAVLATAFAVAVAVLSVLSSSSDHPSGAPAESTGPLPLVTVPAPDAGTPACGDLVRAVPERLKSSGEYLARRELAQPAPPATVAWGAGNPVVLRCGLERPPELSQTSPLRVVNGVQWLEVAGQGSATWYVVDRPVYAALTVPADAGTGVLQDVSDAVARSLPATPLRFG